LLERRQAAPIPKTKNLTALPDAGLSVLDRENGLSGCYYFPEIDLFGGRFSHFGFRSSAFPAKKKKINSNRLFASF
jgi:hypothetical protein